MKVPKFRDVRQRGEKMKKKSLLIILIILLIGYTSMYEYKNNLYKKYEKKYHIWLGRKHNDVIRAFYKKYKHFPNNKELRDFIKQTKLYQDLPISYYLISNKFYIKNNKDNDTIYIYDSGYNFIDENLNKVIKKAKDVNIFNYLIKGGDVIIFYAIKSEVVKKRENKIVDTSKYINYKSRIVKRVDSLGNIIFTIKH